MVNATIDFTLPAWENSFSFGARDDTLLTLSYETSTPQCKDYILIVEPLICLMKEV